MAAILVEPADVARVRRECSHWAAPGARRFHARKESSRRRTSALSRLAKMSDVLSLVIVEDTSAKSAVIAREAILLALAQEATRLRVSRWVIELDESTLEADRRALAGFTRRTRQAKFEYTHAVGSADPLLWPADLATWAWTRGGQSRASIESLVIGHIRL